METCNKDLSWIQNRDVADGALIYGFSDLICAFDNSKFIIYWSGIVDC